MNFLQRIYKIPQAFLQTFFLADIQRDRISKIWSDITNAMHIYRRSAKAKGRNL